MVTEIMFHRWADITAFVTILVKGTPIGAVLKNEDFGFQQLYRGKIDVKLYVDIGSSAQALLGEG